jgi:signal transduction histidine kinase
VRSLYFRIWLTVVAALALFAAVSGWLVQRHLDQERSRIETSVRERVSAWGELMQRSLPAADAPPEDQAAAVRAWADRLRLPMALEAADGRRLGASASFQRRERDLSTPLRRMLPIAFDDGRTLWIIQPRTPHRLGMSAFGPERDPGEGSPPPRPLRPLAPPWPGLEMGALPGLPDGVTLLAFLALLFAAVAAGAFPVVRRLTRRLEALKQGVEAFGAGDLDRRVAEDGRDEVAALGASFNRSAARIEALLRAHQSLLANASHELRSPLARLKMALAMLDDAPADERAALQAEIAANIGELDALVEEVLLASRLDAAAPAGREAAPEPVDLLGLAAEEAARVDAEVGGASLTVQGDERLLRRAIRNLLENARRYGGDMVEVHVARDGPDAVVAVADRGPGVPEGFRQRIFEPFFRLPGHAEREGGVGLGLALVRQIAVRHRGRVDCRPRDGGGSVFSLRLPMH